MSLHQLETLPTRTRVHPAARQPLDVSARLAPGQDPGAVLDQIAAHVRGLDTAGVQVSARPDPALVPGNRLFRRPLHSADLIANARFWRMNWNLAGFYVGRQTDSDFSGLGVTSDPSYVRWDLANSVALGSLASAMWSSAVRTPTPD